jgi:CheY-like chemotaxis protein
MNEATMRENISEEVMENSRNIEVASKILLHTINEILDLARLESGSVEIVKTDYRPASMLSDIVSMTWLRAHEKGLEFRIDVDPELPSVLRGDEMRIKQLLLNVTTNAVKYTNEGSVHLHISGITDEKGMYRSVYEVSDTGIGIREENIPLLFSEFQRMDEHRTNAIEGTGLGLFIVKQYLDMMDGTVEVSSEYGRGSVFHIEIPQEIVDASPVGSQEVMNADQDEADVDASETAASEVRLLVVDDTPMNLMVVKKLLKDSNAAVDTAASGREALQKTLDNEYNIILMDHQMPEMDGIECLHRIREQDGGKCRESRIVCLTANVGADMEKLYMSEGFDGYLTKPIKRKVLEDEIKLI